jgi:glycerol-3-phosphate dehydrogenase
MGNRLIGRYGSEVYSMLDEIGIEEFIPVESSTNLWAEIRWASKVEGIVHLEDLLLRRVRLGNLLPGGGFTVMHRIKDIVLKELKWDEHRWEEELTQYRQLLKQSYSVKV